jgi:hypothetical protein
VSNCPRQAVSPQWQTAAPTARRVSVVYHSYFGFAVSAFSLAPDTNFLPVNSFTRKAGAYAILDYSVSSIRRTRMRAYFRWAFTLAIIAVLGRLSTAAAAERSSTRSSPPDTTPYTRPAVPEDNAPFGQPARPQSPKCEQNETPETKGSAPGEPANKNPARTKGKQPKPKNSETR